MKKIDPFPESKPVKKGAPQAVAEIYRKLRAQPISEEMLRIVRGYKEKQAKKSEERKKTNEQDGENI